MDSLPIIDSASLPADVRSAGRSDQQKYAAAMQFEQMLVQQLMGQLTKSTKSTESDEDEDGGVDATSRAYSQTMPEVLTKVVTQGDGLGLARQMYDSMKEQS